jgi:uncharacterized RDD family membrane protein YckC
MTPFCQECGLPVKGGKCPNGHQEHTLETLPAAPLSRAGALPKAETPRRLLGSGIEFIVYVACGWVIVGLEILSAGLLGLLSLVLVLLVVLRDFNAGAFSIAKRVSRMRVVDRQTRAPASNVQALIRNGYYLGLLVLTVFPFIDIPVLFFFKLFIILDILMILSSPTGRRLGDLLASTQVVNAGN